MSLTDIKQLKKEKGFTIVELLIVIVVIAILAAIVLVSYNGITNRANDVAAKEAAAQLRNKATVWQGIKGTYPSNTQVSGGLVDADVPEAALGNDLQGEVAVGTTAPTTSTPLTYNCATSSATLTYYQSGGNVTDTLGAC